LKKSTAYRRRSRGAFRVSREPFRYFTESQIHALLIADPADYVRSLRSALRAIARGKSRLVLPPKQLFPDARNRGDFRVMPCEVRHGDSATKIVKVIGTNMLQRAVPDQITVGKLLILDPRENFVSAIMEACLLSSARTGACAALAIDALARNRKELVVVGSGRVGTYAALYAVAAAGVKRVVFTDAVPRRARQAAAWLARRYPGVGCEARALAGVESADVVVLATTSARPIRGIAEWGANLVVSLGADTDAQSELDATWARRAELYCDTFDSLRFGDLRAWVKAGLAHRKNISDMLSIYRASPRASPRTRVFISTGSALFDNLTARYLIRQGLR
jgi:ornithine cyclodeaminase/alanine dehydrogenase-like protein (mu-crystallin family)